MRRILLLTGMDPAHRIYDRLLPLLPNAMIVDWIQPAPYESITSYAARLSRTVCCDEPAVVCGVSFGGIVARELASCLNASTCVLIASVRSPRELPPWFRICRVLAPPLAVAIMRITGTVATCCPRRFKSSSTWRLTKLAGKSGAWHRWATVAVLSWKSSEDAQRIPSVQIHGDRDVVFPVRYTSADTIFRGGGHDLPLTHCQEIAGKLLQIAA